MQFEDLIYLELALEIDNLDYYLGKDKWKGIATFATEPPMDFMAAVPKTELQEVLMMWQDAFEWTYYNEVLFGLRQAGH